MAVRLDDTEDEVLLRSSFRALFADHATPTHVRRAESLGHDTELWKRLANMGAPGMSVEVDRGGGGANTTDLVIVAEEAGATIAPVPLNEHLVATRLLAAFDGEGYADVIAGDAIAATAMRPARQGVWEAVPGGAVADVVVGVVGDDLVAARNASRVPLANCGSEPLADIDATGADVSRIGPAHDLLPAIDLWRVLTASSLVGVADSALRIATGYVLERHQFGRPIGSYQAVQHGLAELPGVIAGARLLTGKAAWALDQTEPGTIDLARNDISDRRVLASMAFLFAAETAAAAVDRAVHYHGALGCTVDADIQLYYRRARSWPLVLGALSAERRHLADLLLGAPQ